MATEKPLTPSAPRTLHQPLQQPAGAVQAASPPTTKRDLISWWKQFKKNTKKEEEKGKIF